MNTLSAIIMSGAVQLNARCKDLEELASPKHSAIVRDLLEKEKAVQAKIAQIANSRGQSPHSSVGRKASGSAPLSLIQIQVALSSERRE